MTDEINIIADSVSGILKGSIEELIGQGNKICESPIESIFLTTLMVAKAIWDIPTAPIGRWQIAIALDKEGQDPHSLLNTTSKPETLICVIPQYKWRGYRIDFAVFYWHITDRPAVFVECDGHEFHERTKEQAIRDRSRDREMQIAGIPVLRFTGREIYRNPFACVDQVLECLIGQAERRPTSIPSNEDKDGGPHD